MRLVKLGFITAALLPALIATGGCMDNQESDKTTTTTTAAPALFDPCTGIPDDAVSAAGVNPATKQSGIGGIEQSGWKICAWMGPQYSITVYSSARTVADYEGKADNFDFQDVTISGRTGRQFKVGGGSTDLKCDVVFPAEQGTVQIALMNLASADNPPDPCTSLPKSAAALLPYLPK